MRSEYTDFSGVIKRLLLNGAQPDVKCTLGNGTDTEKLSPLDLARRCDAGEDIISLLQYDLGVRAKFKTQSGIIAEKPVRMYALHGEGDVFCDICFNVSSSTPF